jgi:hypothetical protein
MTDLGELFKSSLVAFFVGIIPAMIFQALSTAVASYNWLMYIIYALIISWSVPKLPREAKTFFDILVVTFLLLAFAGILGLIAPGISWLQWVNISTVPAFLTTLTSAIFALAITEEYIPI